MKPTVAILVALVAVPAGAAPSVRDFELPPGPTATPTTAAPQVQGPVDPDAPGATRPRPVETQAAAPAASPAPTTTATAGSPAPIASPSATARPTSTAQSRPASPATQVEAEATEAPQADQTLPAPATVDQSAPPLATGAPVETTGSWGWIAGVVGGFIVLLGALAAGLLWWRKRQPAAAKVPQIELLLVTPEDEPQPVSPPASLPVTASSPALRIDAAPSHLTRSMMAATFTCRITLENRGESALEDVTVGLDLTTAHGSVPTSEQLADPARLLPEAGKIARIAPGERVEFAQDVRLPTAEIRTLRQGEAQLYVPLLRVRAQAGKAAPVARTFIVGTLPDAEAKKLQPFRLDEMPQTYRMIGVAALD